MFCIYEICSLVSLCTQELFELAQRKFLRQISRYSEDSVLYPRLIVVDFLEMLRQDWTEQETAQQDTEQHSPGTPFTSVIVLNISEEIHQNIDQTLAHTDKHSSGMWLQIL